MKPETRNSKLESARRIACCVFREIHGKASQEFTKHGTRNTAFSDFGFRAGGFTLLEVLLAVVIFAIVLVAIHGVFYGAIRLRNKTTDALEEAVPLQHAVAIIKRDLASIVAPGGTLSGQLQTTPVANTLTPSATTGQQVSPDFYTATGAINDATPWGDIQKVTYYLAEPTNNAAGKDLLRSVSRNLLPVLTEQPEQQWLMSGVQDVTFLFYDGTEWVNSWDSTTQETPLPQAIKVQIQLVTGQTQPVQNSPIEIVVPVDVQARTNQTQQASQ